MIPFRDLVSYCNTKGAGWWESGYPQKSTVWCTFPHRLFTACSSAKNMDAIPWAYLNPHQRELFSHTPTGVAITWIRYGSYSLP